MANQVVLYYIHIFQAACGLPFLFPAATTACKEGSHVPDNELKLLISADASGVQGAADQAKEQMDRAAQSVSVLGDLIGIQVPDAVQKLVASTELLAPAFAEAFPVLAVISFVKELQELDDEHKKVTAAIYGQSDAWRHLEADVSRFSDSTRIKLLEIRERIDSITSGPLKAFKDKLDLIDAESFDQLKQQFQTIAGDATKAFAGMQESWFKAFLTGTRGAQEGIKGIADTFHLVMNQINGMEKAGNMAAIGRLLDDQIAKTKDLIKEDEDENAVGTSNTKYIVAAYRRLLQVLSDLKQAYSEVQQTAADSKRLANLESLAQRQQQVEIISLAAQKSRIQAVHQANQEEVVDYQQAFAAINAATQQFNTQQLSILMTGINQNSAQVIQASKKYFKTLEDDEAKSLARRRKMFDDVFKGISGAFNSFISGMMKGNETLSQAWAKLVDEMAAKFLQGLEKQLMSLLEHKLMEISIHAEAEQTKDAVSEASHAKEGARSAVTTAQHAYEWASEWGGPVAGAAAAAIAFAGVTAFGSAEGGQYLVPSDQLTMLHRNEMVLPAGVADRMRGVIDGGGRGGTTVVVNHTVQAVDAESFQSHIRRHANLIGNEVARALKRKSLS